MNYIRNLADLNAADSDIAGGKAASLGEMINAGFPVPPGFVILAHAFGNQAADLPEGLRAEILVSFKAFDAERVAVRSSAMAEDGAEHSWAGQLDSFLDVAEGALFEKIRLCRASLFNPRAISYRSERGLRSASVSMAVIVQKMAAAEISGIAFSMHPVTYDKNQIIIEASHGLGESIVSGACIPDAYIVEKSARSIIEKESGDSSRATAQILADDLIMELSDLVMAIEKHFGFPCDIEWAFEKGIFHILQCRPITTL